MSTVGQFDVVVVCFSSRTEQFDSMLSMNEHVKMHNYLATVCSGAEQVNSLELSVAGPNKLTVWHCVFQD